MKACEGTCAKGDGGRSAAHLFPLPTRDVLETGPSEPADAAEGEVAGTLVSGAQLRTRAPSENCRHVCAVFHLTLVFLAPQRCQFEALSGQEMPLWCAPVEKSDK